MPTFDPQKSHNTSTSSASRLRSYGSVIFLRIDDRTPDDLPTYQRSNDLVTIFFTAQFLPRSTRCSPTSSRPSGPPVARHATLDISELLSSARPVAQSFQGLPRQQRRLARGDREIPRLRSKSHQQPSTTGEQVKWLRKWRSMAATARQFSKGSEMGPIDRTPSTWTQPAEEYHRSRR